MPKTVIIGGVAGGASAAARLRRLDEKSEIIMLEKGGYISFANCGLPYYVGNVIKEKERLTLQTPQSFKARFNVDVRINSEALSIDRKNKLIKIKNTETGREYEESYDKLIISTGASVIMPDIPGLDNKRVFTIRNIPDTYRITDFINENKPKRAIVAGAGYIGIEMAENIHAKGVEVMVVELSDHVIGPLDSDMAAEVRNHIESKGVKICLNSAVKAVEEKENGLLVTVNNEKVEADFLVMAVGVLPDTKLAKEAGLATGFKGAIITDSHMRTNDPDIYAAGDAVEVTDLVSGIRTNIPLASPANRQGRIAADNIAGIESEYKNTQGSAILKAFDMTVAVTGNNERQLKAAGISFMKSFTYSASHAGYYPGASNIAIKLLFDSKSGKVYGAQLTGFEGVDKRCDVLATAIRAGMTVYDLTNLELCYAPPFSSAKDPVNMAGYVAENLLTGKVKAFYPEDIAGLDLNSITLLDVRTNPEYENGTLSGAYHIPVDELRERLGEIDKNKPVYVFCQIGLRGYVASRILTQSGFNEVYNLSGGYRLYKTIVSKSPERTTGGCSSRFCSKNDKTRLELDACGLQCPGPIMKVYEAMNKLNEGETLSVTATDPAFAEDIESWCRRTKNQLISKSSENGRYNVVIKKGMNMTSDEVKLNPNAKNIIVFSGDLDKAIAGFIIANGAAAMGREVNMFFTFWGLNILRKHERVKVKKNIIEKMFGFMMPRGSQKLKLSKMNMGGMGAAMIKGIMKKKNVSSLEELIQSAIKNGVKITACTMSMDLMGIKKEELIDNISYGGVAAMLGKAEESDMSLFI